MAKSPLRIIDPEQPWDTLGPSDVDLGDDDGPSVSIVHGATRTEHGDGSVTFDESKGSKESTDDGFYRNIADEIDDDELMRIGSELLTGIGLDQDSRRDWLEARAAGIRLLGLKLEEPRGDLGTASAPLARVPA